MTGFPRFFYDAYKHFRDDLEKFSSYNTSIISLLCTCSIFYLWLQSTRCQNCKLRLPQSGQNFRFRLAILKITALSISHAGEIQPMLFKYRPLVFFCHDVSFFAISRQWTLNQNADTEELNASCTADIYTGKFVNTIINGSQGRVVICVFVPSSGHSKCKSFMEPDRKSCPDYVTCRFSLFK